MTGHFENELLEEVRRRWARARDRLSAREHGSLVAVDLYQELTALLEPVRAGEVQGSGSVLEGGPAPTANYRGGLTMTPHETAVWVATYGAKMGLSLDPWESRNWADTAVLQLRRLSGMPGHLLQTEDPGGLAPYWREKR